MSLLMDALKKAELAKRQGAESAGDSAQELDGPAGLALEPLPDGRIEPAVDSGQAPPAAESSMSLATHLEELDAKFLEEAAAAARQVPTPTATKAEPFAPPPAAPDEPVSRQAPIGLAEPPHRPVTESAEAQAQVKAAAQNLFAAKQPEKPENRKGFAVAIGILTMMSVAGIGGYFWWQLQPKGSMLARPGAAPPVAAPTLPAASPATPVAPAPAATAVAPPAPAGPAAPAATGQAARNPAVVSVANDDGVATRPPARRRQPAAVESADDEAPVRITRQPLRVDPALSRGFEAFNRGELAQAQVEYERARKNDPRNTDVLHGLAAIALRQGRADQAEALYRQIMEADPQDPVAAAALLNQRGQVDPGLTESRLKSLAAAQPDLAAPYFSLGNLYARQGRWNDAQQAYFRAYNAEPDNPDILYNLAISLEHLRQNKLAAQYYAQAIAAAATRPAGFDREQVAARLKTLQP